MSFWPYIPDHPYRILIFGGPGSGKTNILLNLIKHQRPDIYQIYLYVKDLFELKYQLFINRRNKVGIKNFKNPKAFTDYLQTMIKFMNICKTISQQRKGER